MEVLIYCINSFTHNNLGGNPAGVVLNAEALTSKQMQNIAAMVGYSETAFVTSDKQCDFNVRFFTPTEEVDFCGHATLATFHLMFEQQLILAQQYTQQTKAGKLNVSITADNVVTMQQTLPQYLGKIASDEVASLLEIDNEWFKSTCLPCEIVSTGLADIIVPVPFGTLDKLKPNDEKISAFSKKYNAVGLHVFELPPTSAQTTITASCRNFAPLFGIPEESATGSASGALACYFAKHNIVASRHYTFEQGIKMGSPSLIYATVSEHKISDKNEITLVEVSGKAYTFNKMIKCIY